MDEEGVDAQTLPGGLKSSLTRQKFLWLAASGLAVAAVDPLEALATKKCKYGTMTVTRIVNGKKKKVKICRPAPRTPTATSTATTTPPPTLRGLADRDGFSIGSQGVSYYLQRSSAYPQYGATLGGQFNMVESADLDWKTAHPSSALYNFADADTVIGFGKTHGMKIFAGSIVPVHDEYVPDWLRNLSADQLRSELKNYIAAVSKKYAGSIDVLTVVNEPLWGQLFYDGFWYQTLGESYIEDALFWTKQVMPQTRLIVSEYTDGETSDTTDHLFSLASDFRDRGVPIDGVGFEMHLNGARPPDVANIQSNLRRFFSAGIPVYITEFDVDMDSASGGEVSILAVQAQIYRDVLSAYLSAGGTFFNMFGFSDAVSWLNDLGEKSPQPLPFDKNYLPKPAFYALLDVLKYPPASL